MVHRRAISRGALAAAALVLIAGCGSDSDLQPAPDGAETSGTIDAGHDTATMPDSRGQGDGALANDPPDAGAVQDGTAADAPFVGPDPAGLAWKPLDELGTSNTEAVSQVALATDGRGSVYLATIVASPTFAPPSSLRVHKLQGSAWQLVGGKPVYTRADVLLAGTRMAASSTGVIAVATSSGVFAFSNGDWQPIAPPPLAAGETRTSDAPDLAFDTSDRLHALFTVRTGGETQVARVMRREGTGWNMVGGDIDLGGTSGLAGGHLAFSPAGKLYVVTRRNKVVLLQGAEWRDLGTPDVASIPGSAFPHIAVGADERPVVTWRENPEGKSEIYAAKYDPAMSGFVPLGGRLNLTGDNASYSRVVIDPAGTPYVVWRESGIYVSRFFEGAWRAYIGDGRASLQSARGTLPSIVLDDQGLPVVAWESFSEEKQVFTAASRAGRH